MDIKHIPQVFEAPIGTLSDPAHRRRFYPPSCCHHDRTACVGHIKPCFLTAVYPGAQGRSEPGERHPSDSHGIGGVMAAEIRRL